MSETNLLKAKYALDLRNIRLSNDRRDGLESPSLSISPKGLVDISDIGKLNEFSSILQKNKTDGMKAGFSSGNLNLFAINNRIRVRMIEIFSKLVEKDIFEEIESYWQNKDEEGYNITRQLFNSIFFQNSENPAIDELVRFWLNFNNPASKIYNIEFLGEDNSIKELSDSISKIMSEVSNSLPSIEEGNMFDYLRKPERNSPNSVKGQIEYIVENWEKYLSQENVKFLLLGLDLLREEEKFRGFGGSGPSDVYEFIKPSSSDDSSHERFTQDENWMPKLVLLAKNVYVWLNQLSGKYNKQIKTLDQIPDEELNTLSSRGITGIWLVGVWERSIASKKIKNMMGNENAIASAYSIYDYKISHDLGGEEAFQILKEKLKDRNIRIGADMVPNHMGIYSKWTVEHPDWFLQTKKVPYPSYTFNGENLSETEGIKFYIEDHYYDQTDAAVTFKRVDTELGESTFIYHGNDGTSFPWNDTAQIDFLNKEARENVIQTIVEVAKKFSIIRFDAAMVLAKQHIRRLWYPAPGEGGDIPSRSQYSMSEEEFNQKIPNEFWREVVDRVSKEAPDTLLLAEAFWLLEGYFVRTLGMHRVYNSAFMKMLQEEENSKYRQTVKNVLEFDPEILKRFVNYLTNPDEEPAIKSFGSDDKYFGLSIMMVTMPGLPMFGHGQFEGFQEKYGMEYIKPQINEKVNIEILTRHKMEIVPLLKKRYLFSGSENFFLYDFFTSNNRVNEDVFAYSNRFNDEKAIVVYNNTYAEAKGWVKRSVAYSQKLNDQTTMLRQVDLFEGLKLENNEGFLLFKDHINNLEYIRSKDEIREKGLYIEIGAFKYHVFVELKEISENKEIWKLVSNELEGRGIENLKVLYEELAQEKVVKSDEVKKESKIAEPIVVEKEDIIIRLKIQIDELKDENIALRGQIESMTSDLRDYNQLKLDYKVLEQQNNQIIESNTAVNSKLSVEMTQNITLKNKITKLENELKELQDSKSDKEYDEIKSLQIENNNLLSEIERLRMIEAEHTDLKEDYDEIYSRLKIQTQKSNDLENKLNGLNSDISDLQKEFEEIQAQALEDDIPKPKDIMFSSGLVEKIINRLETTKSEIKLRNLAMALGVSGSVCLDHVKTMEKDKLVELRYTTPDDQNPRVILVLK